MAHSSSPEPSKATKRKGTRSVSTLTPSQLARKRANDREAQRAIRARTKDHIERLEQELKDVKSAQPDGQAYRDLVRQNQVLEKQVRELKMAMSTTMTSPPYSTSVYDDSLSTTSGHISSPRASPFPTSDYQSMSDFNSQYVPLTSNCETWASGVALPSNVSSPSSSAHADDYAAGYIPTSAPTSMVPSSNNSSNNATAVALKAVKMEFDEVDNHVPRDGVSYDGQRVFANGPSPVTLHATAPSAAAPAAAVERVSRSGVLSPAPVIGSLNLQPYPGGSFWQIPVYITAPACRADELLVGFIHSCRRLSRIESIYEMLGPPRIDVRSLFTDQQQQQQMMMPRRHQQRHMPPSPLATASSPHPITDLVRALIDNGGITRLIERIAAFAPMQTFICWLAHPTPETRARVCADYIPLQSQLSTPHPQWLDLVRQGALREIMIARQDVYATEEFQRVYSDALRLVNWPFPSLDGLITDSRTGHVWLSDALMAHAMDGNNWRLNESFARRYPELGGFVDIERDD
ncbi:hypothetical protein G7046_g922 [Stylonectria norvegica]|nr:hypothetical protein G7046_g922 [Stylonectria norvegica]